MSQADSAQLRTAEAVGAARGEMRALITLALPIIAMMVSRMLMGFIDFVMVKELGTDAQAAISPATMLVFTLGCLGLGIANAVQTFVAQADGRGEPHVAGAYTWQTLYLAGVCTLWIWPLAETTPIWLGWIAALGQHPEAMLALEIEYTRIALWSMPFAVLSMGFNAFFMGIQKPTVGLFAVLLSLVVNGVGNYVLIFGHFGFPEMGMAGAAVATVLGWAVRAVFLGALMVGPAFDARYHTRRTLGLSLSKLRDLLRIGLPTALQWVVEIGSWLVFLALIMPPYGLVAVAASNVALQYMHMGFMPAIGLGIALCSQVGFAIGAGDLDRAERYARVAMRATGTYMGGIALLFLVAGWPLMRIMNDDPAVIRAGQLVLLGAAVFQVFDAMSITYMNALRGAGETRWPAIITALGCWLIFIGGGFAVSRLAPQFGLLGPWAMCALYIILLGLLLRWRWIRGGWRSIRLFEQARTDGLAPAPDAMLAAQTEPAATASTADPACCKG